MKLWKINLMENLEEPVCWLLKRIDGKYLNTIYFFLYQMIICKNTQMKLKSTMAMTKYKNTNY